MQPFDQPQGEPASNRQQDRPITRNQGGQPTDLEHDDAERAKGLRSVQVAS